MNENNQIKSPSSWKYIGVWFLWSISSGVIVLIFAFLVGIFYEIAGMEFSENNLIDISIFYSGSYMIAVLMFIAIYERFLSLKISKVMPYLWVIGFFGMAMSWGDADEAYRSFGNSKDDASPLFFLFIILYILHNLIIYFYFRKKNQWKTSVYK